MNNEIDIKLLRRLADCIGEDPQEILDTMTDISCRPER